MADGSPDPKNSSKHIKIAKLIRIFSAQKKNWEIVRRNPQKKCLDGTKGNPVSSSNSTRSSGLSILITIKPPTPACRAIFQNKEKIEKEEKDFPDAIIKYLNEDTTEKNDTNQVWVNCEGENVADQENMGDLDYFPKSRGFHEKYNMFDLESLKAGYRSPLVAIKFKNPKYGRLLHVECRAWAQNIGYNHMDRIGKAHFEMIIYGEDKNPLTIGSDEKISN